ncbi:uncharacterized protein LOC131143463 isoform X3 [Malania oleifera]|uniref:uncharacterized protein LOC131143463 isoform X3 n=1 Tax=Malania oleifera TaxID=397392 RepID=UPI0025AE95C8|nr:uncharacterized protein LOC131143463 isoform X3 [Malania oleifera]XP_057947756.1 uncharacterized protein LOC131143463 isoform X3 [Malania oleifera]
MHSCSIHMLIQQHGDKLLEKEQHLSNIGHNSSFFTPFYQPIKTKNLVTQPEDAASKEMHVFEDAQSLSNGTIVEFVILNVFIDANSRFNSTVLPKRRSQTMGRLLLVTNSKELGQGNVDYPYFLPGRKQPFSALEDPFYPDPRGYPHGRLESLFPVASARFTV